MPFTPKFVDLVKNSTTVQGSGPVTLGSAAPGFTSFAAACAAGDQFYYCLQGVDKPAEREVGRGTMQSDGKIARAPIGPAQNFTSGTKTIALIAAAEWFTQLDQAARTPAGASGRELSAESFGAAADSNGTGGTNSYTGILAGIDNVAGASPYQNISPVVTFGHGTAEVSSAYRVGQTLDVHTKAHLKGRNSGHNGSGVVFDSELVWPADTLCIRSHNSNTFQDTDQPTDVTSGAGTIYEGLTISQASQGSDLTKHGLWMRGTATVRSCVFRRIAGNAIHLNATAGMSGQYQGDANNWRIVDSHVATCGGDALAIDGNDCNAGYSLHLITHNGVAGCGIYDAASLGNVHIAPQLTGYGNGGVVDGGRKYQLIVHELTSTTAPGADPAGWRDVGAGTATVSFPQWVSGTTYRAKLPFLITNHHTTVFGGYEEHGQVNSRSAGLVIGGNHSTTVDTPHFRVPAPHGPAICHTGVGGYKTSIPGTARDTKCGEFCSVIVGGVNFYDADGPTSIYSAIVDKDGSLANELTYLQNNWVAAYQTRKPYYYLTGPNSATDFGRSVAGAEAYQLVVPGFILTDASSSNGVKMLAGAAAAPVAGTWNEGDILFNRFPNNGVFAYQCIASGTPGTWAALGIGLSVATIGYKKDGGAGGGVVQAADKSTGVTLNKPTGYIVMNGASLAAGAAVSFTLTNSMIAADDVPQVVISQAASAGAYLVQVDAVANGSCRISLRNLSGGALAEAVVLNFALLSGSYD